jgi:hypothetical protein
MEQPEWAGKMAGMSTACLLPSRAMLSFLVGQTIVLCRLPTCIVLADRGMRWSAPQSDQY